MRSNCILYALNRLRKEGGYVVIRRSYYGWWPHMMWSKDLITFWEFDWMRPKREWKWWWIPPLLFEGKEKRRGA